MVIIVYIMIITIFTTSGLKVADINPSSMNTLHLLLQIRKLLSRLLNAYRIP